MEHILEGNARKNARKDNSEKTSEKIISFIKEEPTVTAVSLASKLGISSIAVEYQLKNFITIIL